MNRNDWQSIQAIHMNIQTVDLHHIGIQINKELNISCGLINIARGQCNIRICPRSTQDLKKAIGNLHISADRPVMTADISMPSNIFDEIVSSLKLQFSRPGTIILLLGQDLLVNLVGDLKIETSRNINIRDISWIFPIQ